MTPEEMIQRNIDTVDPEIYDLLTYINRVEGIRTTESCFGHNESPCMIFCEADSIATVHKFMRDYFYNDKLWTIQLYITDTLIDDNDWDKVVFALQSDVRYTDWVFSKERRCEMKYAKFSDDFLSYFRLDDNGETLVLTDKRGFTRAVKLLPCKGRSQGEWIVVKQDNEGIHEIKCPFCKYSKGSDFSSILIVTFDRFPPFCENCGAQMAIKEDQEDG